MTSIFSGRIAFLALGAAVVATTLAATGLATAAPGRASCEEGVAGAEPCVSTCADDQLLDASTGECRAKANQNAAATPAASEAPLKAAWEQAFGPLPKPEDFALWRVDNPSVALPGVGLPGVGVNLLNIVPPVGVGTAAAALPALAAAPPPLPPLPAAPPLPAPPPMPCVGFATPIPFVGFSTC